MENTPRNFALQLGALITLYVSIGALITLLFSVINLAFPDAADSYWRYENAATSIRFSIALLVVFFPAYLWLTRTSNNIRRQEHGTYLTLTKWLIYLSLVVGGAVLLGDGVAVIFAFLEGEITMRFLLKAAALAVVLKAAFYYYLMDAKGYWQTHEKQSIRYGLAASVVVLGALALGFMHSETPQEVREMRIDDHQVQALQEIQWRIEEYYRVNETLPETLEEAYGLAKSPTPPEERQQVYGYNVIDETHYELCATFSHPSLKGDEYTRVFDSAYLNYSWEHGAGEWCFERVIESKI